MDFASGRRSLISLISLISLAPACGSEVADTVCADVAFEPGDILVRWQNALAAHTQPLVADLDGDAVPEVVVNATRASADPAQLGALGEVVVLDGASGREKWRVADDPDAGRFGSHGHATFALADVDGDGALDIVYAGRGDASDASLIHAVDGAGELLWSSRDPGGDAVRLRVENGAIAAANLDDDAAAEIIVGAAILDHDGTLVAQAGADASLLGSPHDEVGRLLYPGGLPAVADVDGDGRPEIVTGRDAWRVDWIAGAPPTVTLTPLWHDTSGHGHDGYPALGDLDGDGAPEVVLTAWPDIRVLDARTGRPWCGRDPSGADCLADPGQSTAAITIAGGNLGGPPTLADFDGDGRLEAGIASGSAYTVYDFHRPHEEVVSADGLIPPPGAMYVRWSQPTQDNSSAATGSAVFDLDADGILEVFHQDECQLHIYDGASGEPRFQAIHSSYTIHEHPIVADVDGDGASELLAIANLGQVAGNTSCKARLPDFTPRDGVFLYAPGSGRWAPAAPLWTQYDFHVTNAGPDGNVPLAETPPWADGGSNSVRQAAAVACE